MANSTISGLPSGLPALGTDLIPIARSGANYNLTLASLLAQSGSTFNVNSSTGNVTIAAPTSGVALTVNGSSSGYAAQFFGGANYPGLWITGSSTSGQSYGLQIAAGTTAGDYPLIIKNAALSNMFLVSGTGNVTINAPTSGAGLSVATQSSYGYAIVATATTGNSTSISLCGNGASPGTNSYDLIVDGSGNAYLQNRANTTLSISTNNTTRISISSSGNVTIGPPISGTALTINGTTTSTGAITISAGSGSGNAYLLLTGWNSGVASTAQIFADYTGDIKMVPAASSGIYLQTPLGANALTVGGNGNVTIGPPSSGTALMINGLTGAIAALSIMHGASGGYSAFYDSTGLYYLQLIPSSSAIYMSAQAAPIALQTNGSTRLTIGIAGGVTIAAVATQPALQVNGNFVGVNPSSTYNMNLSAPAGFASYITLQGNGNAGSAGFQIAQGADGNAYIITQNATYLYFQTNALLRGYIAPAGNWVVSTPSSGFALIVNGISGSPVVRLSQPTSADVLLSLFSTGSREWQFGYRVSGGYLDFYDASGSYSALQIKNGGGVTIPTPASGGALTVNGVGSSPTLTLSGATSSSANLLMVSNAGSGTFYWLSAKNSGILHIGGNGATEPAAGVIQINNTGNVTIAAPTSGTSLQVQMVASGAAFSTVGTSGSGIDLHYGASNNVDSSFNIYVSQAGAVSKYTQIGTFTNTTLYLATNSLPRLTIGQVGNVSIAAPSSAATTLTLTGYAGAASLPLSINTNYQSAATTWFSSGGTTGGQVSLIFDTNGNPQLYNQVASTTFYMGSVATGTSTIITSAGANRVVIGSAGNITVNVPSSGTTLTANVITGNLGVVATDGNVGQVMGYTSGTGAAGVAFAGTSTNHAYNLITNNTGRFYIGPAGNITAGPATSGIAFTVTNPYTSAVQSWASTGGTTNGSLNLGFDTNANVSFYSQVANTGFYLGSQATNTTMFLVTNNAIRLSISTQGVVTLPAPASNSGGFVITPIAQANLPSGASAAAGMLAIINNAGTITPGGALTSGSATALVVYNGSSWIFV